MLSCRVPRVQRSATAGASISRGSRQAWKHKSSEAAVQGLGARGELVRGSGRPLLRFAADAELVAARTTFPLE
jgi:hypothetical protein